MTRGSVGSALQHGYEKTLAGATAGGAVVGPVHHHSGYLGAELRRPRRGRPVTLDRADARGLAGSQPNPVLGAGPHRRRAVCSDGGVARGPQGASRLAPPWNEVGARSSHRATHRAGAGRRVTGTTGVRSFQAWVRPCYVSGPPNPRSHDYQRPLLVAGCPLHDPVCRLVRLSPTTKLARLRTPWALFPLRLRPACHPRPVPGVRDSCGPNAAGDMSVAPTVPAAARPPAGRCAPA